MNAEQIPVTRPALRYHGSKWRLAPWIISHFPAHGCYVEPFGGGAGVLLRKKRSAGEIYNDLDGRVVNVFRVLQNPKTATELARRLFLTPYAREEFFDAFLENADDDAVELARKTCIRSFMGFGANAITRTARSGFRSKRNGDKFPSYDFANYPACIVGFTERLRGVVIDNRDGLDVMQIYDDINTLHYVDPPYMFAMRSKSNLKSYICEMNDNDHEKLCKFLLTLKGMVVLSGYDNEIYNDILKGWKVFQHDSLCEKAKKAEEYIWCSPNSRQQKFLSLLE